MRTDTRMDRQDAQISEHRAFLDLLSAEVEEHVFTPPSEPERQHRDRLSAGRDVRVRRAVRSQQHAIGQAAPTNRTGAHCDLEFHVYACRQLGARALLPH